MIGIGACGTMRSIEQLIPNNALEMANCLHECCIVKCSRDRQASTQSLVPIAVRPAPVPLRGLRTVAAKRGFRPRPGLEGAERLGPLYSAQENSGLYLVLLTDNCTGRRDRTRRER